MILEGVVDLLDAVLLGELAELRFCAARGAAEQGHVLGLHGGRCSFGVGWGSRAPGTRARRRSAARNRSGDRPRTAMRALRAAQEPGPAPHRARDVEVPPGTR